MAEFIPRYQNDNEPIVKGKAGILPNTYFNLLCLEKGEKWEGHVEGFEIVCLVLKGNCDVEVNGYRFSSVGKREDMWSGKPESVYAPAGAFIRIVANKDLTEIALTGGACEQRHEAFRVNQEEVDLIEVGSSETKTYRKIIDVLGKKAIGKTGNILVKELFSEGCWAGYPPHKHDTENPPEETAFEELYYFRYKPENGFGVQVVFQDDGTAQSFMTRDGDTVLIDKGYHPSVFSPGHEAYALCILNGLRQRSLILNVKNDYRYLADLIPGINEMKDNFRKS